MDVGRPNGARASRGTVLFVDLRGYTTLAENLDPVEVAKLVEEFYAISGRVVEAHGGEVHNLAGDMLMAVFGLGRDSVDASRAAVASGRRMIEAFQPCARRWERDFGIATGIGVGVHEGRIVDTVLGPATLRRRTLVGDTVNVAARLCHRARAGEVLFSAEVAARLDDVAASDVIPLPNFSLRGRAAPVRIHCIPTLERLHTGEALENQPAA
jgi:adenylate cyclase